MLILQAIIMGIVEGITEFLPVSSTGHLIIVGNFIGFTGDFAKTFEVVIQLGAILAVIFYYRKKIGQSLKIKNIKPGGWGFKLWFKIILAFIPAAAVGFLTNDYIDSYLFFPLTVAIALVIGAVMMLIVEKAFARYKYNDMDKIGAKKSFLIGVAQIMSLFPGMSRSASTIMGGMMVGLSIKAAAEFSFFLAMPTMIAATGFSLVKGIGSITSMEWAALAVGFVVSFIVALLVVDKFLSYLTKHPLKPFAYYRLAAGLIMIILVLSKIVK